MNNIQSVDIKDIDLNNAYFHFTTRDNLDKIDSEGLQARVGDASKMVGDEKARVYMSRGGKGILGIKNSFIYEFKNLRICDIPNEYKKYFDIKDYSSTDKVKIEDVYSAMEKRFKDEIYLKVDAIEGEDYSNEEVFGITASYDIKGKENHNIGVEKLSLLTTERGNSTLDIIQYIYNRFLMKNPEKEDIIKGMNSDLVGLFEYIDQRDNTITGKRQNQENCQKSTQDLGKETLEEQKDIALLDTIKEIEEAEIAKQKEETQDKNI